MINLNSAIYFLILFTFTCSQLGRNRNLYENDMCKPGDSRWMCKKLSDCPAGLQGIKTGRRPEICSFNGMEPIVCCEPEQSRDPLPVQPVSMQPDVDTSVVSSPNSKAREMCNKYAEYVFQKGSVVLLGLNIEEQTTVKYDQCPITSQPLVVGGVDANRGEFPHMAQIGYGESPRIAWLCGGSLISERFVLSAAHCTRPGSRGPAKWARLGVLNTAEIDDRRVIARIAERYDHPDYDSIRLYNDIALYKLENDVKLNHNVRPLCLDLGDKNFKEAVATGWGHTEWGGTGSETLKKVSLNVVNIRRCNKSYESNVGRQLPRGIDGTSMLCAGDQEGKDTCQGDSGGPLQISLKEPYCMYAQVGVTSFGKQCGSNNPGVYTLVSHYVPWIENIVWP